MNPPNGQAQSTSKLWCVVDGFDECVSMLPFWSFRALPRFPFYVFHVFVLSMLSFLLFYSTCVYYKCVSKCCYNLFDIYVYVSGSLFDCGLYYNKFEASWQCLESAFATTDRPLFRT